MTKPLWRLSMQRRAQDPGSAEQSQETSCNPVGQTGPWRSDRVGQGRSSSRIPYFPTGLVPRDYGEQVSYSASPAFAASLCWGPNGLCWPWGPGPASLIPAEEGGEGSGLCSVGASGRGKAAGGSTEPRHPPPPPQCLRQGTGAPFDMAVQCWEPWGCWLAWELAHGS